ncbi:MAG TPA: polymer-forming cytoskeletal protein [Candidatus Dormibacteraeota bacterium]|nr:polymer-forming cytoskeletal protein [Candidatus Dormibacteraeota bacterium]
MRRVKQQARLITLIGVMVAVLGTVAGIGLATTGAQGGDKTPGVTNASIYRTGRNINVTGVINGDVFCAGQTVNVDATVNGDVICAGQTVDVTGKVNGNVRLAGQTVTLGADVTKAASLAGQDITVESGATISNDLSLLGQSATVNGRVGRDVTATVNSLVVDGTIGRNLSATVVRLDLQGRAAVKGGLFYSSERRDALRKASSAQINGREAFHQTPARGNRSGWSRGAGWIWRIYWEVSLIVFALVLAALFPQLFDGWNQVARRRFWLALLTGFLAMFIVPAIIIALFVSVIGVPLALLLMLLWLVAIALSTPIAAYYIGSRILHGGVSIPLIMLLGAVILAILCLIPFVGWVITVVAYWFGTGALLLNLRGGFARPQYHAAPEPNA